MKNLKLKMGLVYGLITSILTILIGLILYYSGLASYTSGSSFWVSILIITLGFYLATEQFKKENGNYMTYGEGVKIGLWIGLTLGIVSGIYAIVFNYLDPSMMEKILNQMEVQMEEQGQNEEQIEMALEVTKWFTNPPVLFLISLISNLFFSWIVALIVGNFTKKEKPVFE